MDIRKIKDQNKNIEDLKELARVLDEQFKLPFGIKFGWDFILGIIPGIGDFVPHVIGSYIVIRAVQINVSVSIIIRMILNLGIDYLVGSIPFLGDAFDVFWKANDKNYKLVEAYVNSPESTTRRSSILNGSLLIGVAFVLLSLLGFSLYLVMSIWSWVGALFS